MMKTSSQNSRTKNDIRRQRRNVLPLESTDTIAHFHPNEDYNTGYELHSKKDDHYIEKELQPNDTLQSLALDFNCSIAELKRVNKIHKENEIFALRVVKIPIIPGSFIIEKLKSGASGLEQQQPSVKAGELLHAQVPTFNNPVDKNISILSSNENQKCDILSSFNDQSESSIQSDHIDLSERTSFQLEEAPVSIQEARLLWRYNGDDCGISWKPLLILIVSLGLVGPLLYIYFSA